MISRVVTIIIGLAALAAAVISFNLTIKHIHGTTGLAWFESVCSATPGADAGCAKVLNSPYSYFPPKHTDQPGGFHLPAAFLGLIYYSALSLWIIGVGRPSPDRRSVHLLALLCVGLGLGFSAWFMWVMYRKVGEWCPWCLVTHGLNLLIAIGLVAIWPRRRWSDPAASNSGAVGQPHPTNRVIAMTMLSILLISYGHLFFFEWRGKIRDNKQLTEQIEVLRSNVGGFIAQWQMAPVCTLTPRPDEAVRVFTRNPQSEPLLDVVVFSDFECPGCAKFPEFFDEKVVPLFNNNVRLSFRHNPWDQSCNPRSSRNLHPHACSAAMWAEAARGTGGSAAFWKAHDYLFENRSETAAGTLSAEGLAAATGLDLSTLRASAESETHRARISQDIEQGAACGVRATPTLFVEGKRIENAATSNLDFWDKLADWYWLEKAKKDRPAHARRNSTPVNP